MPPARWQARLPSFSVLQPLPFIALFSGLVAWVGSGAAHSADPKQALVEALAPRNLKLDAKQVVWVDPKPSALGSLFGARRAMFRAHLDGEPADIYLARARLTPEGRLIEVGLLHNVSDTSAVDERGLVVQGEQAAWVIGSGGRTYSIQTVDLAASNESHPSSWTVLQRAQQRVTNLQATGQSGGIIRRSFKLEPAAEHVQLSFANGALLVDADGRKVRIDGETNLDQTAWLTEQEHFAARPGNVVTWAVDRVRALPWFGSDKMQAVKAVAFAGLDWVQRAVGTVTGDDGSRQVAEEFGDLMNTPLVEHTDPDSGFPPAALKPVLSPALEDEGKWRPLDKDPFILTNPGAPPPFATTFIRTDRKRAYSQIFITLWDPRQVSLHAMSGTVEPKSATGETGPGLVPRAPEVIGRLLGGFNGGFQATHGEFGMMADGVVYLPPKPYGATVAELEDGSTAFGTWPRDDTVPSHVRSMRQNMTPLVMDGKINPYQRHWWGGVPPGWTDEARTVRSGVCLTRDNFVAYLYGSTIDADHLAQAMQSTGCVYGLHLDMNPGHSGLEFYRTAPKGQLPDAGATLDGRWQARGPIPGLPDWEFQGRRMLRYMALMNFPRYINREARDFFYLTLRHVLPGPPLRSAASPPEPDEGVWKLSGLPQHGWPHALAMTSVRPDATRQSTRVRVLKLDPRTVALGTSGQIVLSVAPTSSEGSGLYFAKDRFHLGDAVANATRLASGHRESQQETIAALGLDAAGFLIYAVVSGARSPDRDGALLQRVMKDAGAREVLFLNAPWDLALGGDRDLSGHPMAERDGALRLVRREAPGARRLFPDTPVVAPKVWYPLQARRVRYFRKPKPAESDATAASDTPAEPTPEAP